MSAIEPVDVSRLVLDVHRDLRVTTRAPRPGPPERIDGLTLGVVSMESAPPHGGEVHPDGDEILLVLSGRVRVVGDTAAPLELGPGEACIVRRGEWHRIDLLEPVRLLYLTPGPNGDHRPAR